MKIAITYNADTHLKPHLNEVERLGEDEVAESARDVFAALSRHYDCALFPVGDCITTALLEIRASPRGPRRPARLRRGACPGGHPRPARARPVRPRDRQTLLRRRRHRRR